MLSGRQEDIKSGLPCNHSLIASVLIKIASDARIREEFPATIRYLDAFKKALGQGNKEDIEEALSRLYVILHNAGSLYTDEERQVLQLKGGYLCYPGGLYPLFLAGDFITRDTVTADLGSGNGLQGFMLQQLYPHRKTIQIEISREMIRIGKLYQRILGIEEEKIEWINDDIMNASFEEADLVYIYRPARPVEGLALYRNIAERLKGSDKNITVFSVADCLAPHISDKFTTCYDDGHLKVFVNYEASFSVSHSQAGDLPFP